MLSPVLCPYSFTAFPGVRNKLKRRKFSNEISRNCNLINLNLKVFKMDQIRLKLEVNGKQKESYSFERKWTEISFKIKPINFWIFWIWIFKNPVSYMLGYLKKRPRLLMKSLSLNSIYTREQQLPCVPSIKLFDKNDLISEQVTLPNSVGSPLDWKATLNGVKMVIEISSRYSQIQSECLGLVICQLYWCLLWLVTSRSHVKWTNLSYTRGTPYTEEVYIASIFWYLRSV